MLDIYQYNKNEIGKTDMKCMFLYHIFNTQNSKIVDIYLPQSFNQTVIYDRQIGQSYMKTEQQGFIFSIAETVSFFSHCQKSNSNSFSPHSSLPPSLPHPFLPPPFSSFILCCSGDQTKGLPLYQCQASTLTVNNISVLQFCISHKASVIQPKMKMLEEKGVFFLTIQIYTKECPSHGKKCY